MTLKYAVEQRLRMIDFLLAEYGHVNRSAIVDYFGMGPAQATRDFIEYKKLAPLNTTYSSKYRTYYKTNGFNRVWL